MQKCITSWFKVHGKNIFKQQIDGKIFKGRRLVMHIIWKIGKQTKRPVSWLNNNGNGIKKNPSQSRI